MSSRTGRIPPIGAGITPVMSLFSDQIVAERKDSICVQFQYNIATDDAIADTDITGSVTQDDSKAVCQTGVGVGAFAALQSRKSLRYFPGHEGYCLFTATFTVDGNQQGIAGTEQFAGLFDDLNGFMIGFRGLNFVCIVRRNGIDTDILQDDFNGDDYHLDFADLNVYRIRFGWLGSANTLYQVLRNDGVWLTIHTVRFPGTSPSTNIGNPVLPVRIFVDNGITEQNVSVTSASWNAGNVGGLSREAERYKSFNHTKNVTNGVWTQMFTMRSAELFQGQPNRVRVTPVFIAGGFDTVPIARLDVLKNATINGVPNFNEIDAQNSVISVDIDGTTVADPGEPIMSFAVSRGSNVNAAAREMSIFIESSETLTFAFLPEATGEAIVGCRWAEMF
jgi:hypothetical protein